ncbi:MAG: response regulator, partial [Boseongicola sp.]|nr:response regulator [Boseongicola sp.]
REPIEALEAVEPPEPKVEAPTLIEVEPPVPDDDTPRRMRVLAAEDNKTNRFVLEKMLKSLDIDLVFAENGIEAIEAFEAARPDVFFTDISMPKMDGKEATRRIRALEAEQGSEPCPIIAITAHAMEGDQEEILAAGIDHCLTKPLKKQKLIDHILTAQPLDARPCLPMDDDEAPDTTKAIKVSG